MNMSWVELDIHPFSINYMYEYRQEQGKPDRKRTDAYNKWREKFSELYKPGVVDLQFWYDIDFDKPLILEIEYIAKDVFDTDDILKSFIDCLFNDYYDVDDNIIHEVIVRRRGTVDNYSKGKMRFRLRNVDESLLEDWE